MSITSKKPCPQLAYIRWRIAAHLGVSDTLSVPHRKRAEPRRISKSSQDALRLIIQGHRKIAGSVPCRPRGLHQITPKLKRRIPATLAPASVGIIPALRRKIATTEASDSASAQGSILA
jgi:hypothetical protein